MAARVRHVNLRCGPIACALTALICVVVCFVCPIFRFDIVSNCHFDLQVLISRLHIELG